MNSNYYYFSPRLYLCLAIYRLVTKKNMIFPLVKIIVREGVIFVRFLPLYLHHVCMCQFTSFRVYLIYDGNNDIFALDTYTKCIMCTLVGMKAFEKKVYHDLVE